MTDQIQTCSREQPHAGPCNGWPCEHARTVHSLGEDGRPLANKLCMLPKPPRFYRAERQWHFNYKIVRQVYFNPFFKSEGGVVDEHFVFCALWKPSNGWYEIIDVYFDGHFVRGINLLGLALGWGLTYDARPLAEWIKP